MKSHEAACSCGQLRAVAEGDPVGVTVCHCLACQRRTGSAFGVQARFARDRVTVSGDWQEYLRHGDDDGELRRFRFCGHCGATVFYDYGSGPDAVVIPVGSFADPTFAAPQRSIYESRRHPWAMIAGGSVGHHI
jgi:hypothetical protein